MPGSWDGKTERRGAQHTHIYNEELIERVAESAVKKAFRLLDIDLDNEEAVESVKGLASLMRAFRRTRKAAFQEFTKVIGQLLALAFITYISVKLGFFNLVEELRKIIGG